jgi:DNA modification methylase
MQDQQASLLITSPPYGQQHDYTAKIADWDALMRGAFSGLPMAPDGQILVNIGIYYRHNEWVEYYHPWLQWMSSASGWRRAGWYVWDKLNGTPGGVHARLARCHEWSFHFNELSRFPNETLQKKPASIRINTRSTSLRNPDGTFCCVSNPMESLHTNKIPDTVFRLSLEKANGLARRHPAVFPVKLPQQLIETWSSSVGDIVYEPFAGSGSTILAAERTGRTCYAIEISPEYCDIAIARFQKEFPPRVDVQALWQDVCGN